MKCKCNLFQCKCNLFHANVIYFSIDCLKKRWNALRIKFDKYKRAELRESGIELCKVTKLKALLSNNNS